MPSIDRIVFFGTPEFAVPSLKALVDADRAPELVVAQPDRKAGRGGEVRRPAVALAAEELGLPLVQPQSVQDEGFLDRVGGLKPDLGVVVAFGQIFPARLLELPVHGCINLHASLLPRWRGAAPIQAAIAAGDRHTGVTAVQMDVELDAGPILLQRRTEIGERETAPQLEARLAVLGAELLVETIAELESGALEPNPQEAGLVTWAQRLERQDGRIDWRLTSARIYDRWRAFQPWPGLFTEASGERLKILAVQPTSGEAAARPGTLLAVEEETVVVACGEGTALALLELQRPGRRAMAAADAARGLRLEPGGRLGAPNKPEIESEGGP